MLAGSIGGKEDGPPERRETFGTKAVRRAPIDTHSLTRLRTFSAGRSSLCFSWSRDEEIRCGKDALCVGLTEMQAAGDYKGTHPCPTVGSNFGAHGNGEIVFWPKWRRLSGFTHAPQPATSKGPHAPRDGTSDVST